MKKILTGIIIGTILAFGAPAFAQSAPTIPAIINQLIDINVKLIQMNASLIAENQSLKARIGTLESLKPTSVQTSAVAPASQNTSCKPVVKVCTGEGCDPEATSPKAHVEIQ